MNSFCSYDFGTWPEQKKMPTYFGYLLHPITYRLDFSIGFPQPEINFFFIGKTFLKRKI